MEPTVVPAIIARTQEELDQMLSKVINFADRIMLDIMDGIIVETNSLNFNFNISSGPEYEAHLMVNNPIEYLQNLDEKISRVIIHVGKQSNIENLAEKVRETGREFYAALNPEVNVSILRNMLSHIDGILIMTVNPGRYGAKFIPEALEKVQKIRSWDKMIPIEVDGGMKPETAKLAVSAGTTVIASGSYIMKSEDVERAIKQLTDIMSP